MSLENQNAKRSPRAEAPFPWRCHHCGQSKVTTTTVPFDIDVRHDGRVHAIHIERLELPMCTSCGEKTFTEKVDAQINDALRAHLHLLTPAQIRDGIQRVGMTQKEVAQRLGIAEATLSRWLTETQIQSRAMDNLMRVFFAFPRLRSVLSGDKQDPALGLRDVV